MADNTILPIGTGGDTIRTISRAGVKTQVTQLDVGGEAGPESLVTSNNPLPVVPTGTTVVAGTVSVGNFPATQVVSGTVAVSNLPATQAISAVALPLPANAAQEAGGNLASLVSLTTQLQQLIELNRMMLATLRADNLMLASLTGVSVNPGDMLDDVTFQ